uniref:Secreted protein n=1 Tax=Helianthus annuus TaxID=4232 RepID=A0A251VDB5_HELAN
MMRIMTLKFLVVLVLMIWYQDIVHIIGTCCLGSWSGHGSSYMKTQHKTKSFYMWFINTYRIKYASAAFRCISLELAVWEAGVVMGRVT